jgi:hypothetical protein
MGRFLSVLPYFHESMVYKLSHILIKFPPLLVPSLPPELREILVGVRLRSRSRFQRPAPHDYSRGPSATAGGLAGLAINLPI